MPPANPSDSLDPGPGREAAKPSAPAPCRVLLVDDHETFLRIAARYLESRDYLQLVGVAAGVEEGLRMAEATRPDVVLLDWSMPGRNGYDAIPSLKALEPAPRIVILTSMEPVYQAQALAAGADGFVEKGRMTHDLQAEIERVLSITSGPSFG